MGEAAIQSKRYNPYFVAYIKAKRLNFGDEIRGYEYINWIQDKHRQFRKKFNMAKEKEWIGYTPIEQSLFEKWLDEIASVEALNDWVNDGCEKDGEG
jgi:hypothetical protein